MREIKFRAWEGKRMFYDFTISSLDGEPFAENGNAYPEWILQQFTGLLDKNNKEIYEGDIVKDGNKKFEIKWSSILMGWQMRTLNKNPDKFMHFSTANLEIIGNIYENEELI